MRSSKYWDAFNERSKETVYCVNNGLPVPVRRVAIFVTNACQLRCAYCNHSLGKKEMSVETFDYIVKKYNGAIFHVTGGEPSTVDWLYPYLKLHVNHFHLNTNAVETPPSDSVPSRCP